METVLVSIRLTLWCRFGLLVMMCGRFTTLVLLGIELCLGEALSPNALSSCLFLYWSSWFDFMDDAWSFSYWPALDFPLWPALDFPLWLVTSGLMP